MLRRKGECIMYYNELSKEAKQFAISQISEKIPNYGLYLTKDINESLSHLLSNAFDGVINTLENITIFDKDEIYNLSEAVYGYGFVKFDEAVKNGEISRIIIDVFATNDDNRLQIFSDNLDECDLEEARTAILKWLNTGISYYNRESQTSIQYYMSDNHKGNFLRDHMVKFDSSGNYID